MTDRRAVSPDNSLCNSVTLGVSIVCYRQPRERLKSVLGALCASLENANASCAERLAVRLSLVDNSPQLCPVPLVSDLLSVSQQALFDAIDVIKLSDNPGFGAANNRAIFNVKSAFHLVLNPDAELEGNALCVGLSHLRNHAETVAVCPRVFAPGGQREYLARAYPSVLVLLLRGFAPGWLRNRFRHRMADYEVRDQCAEGADAVPVLLASGCCLLCRTSALEEVGGFDERYFLYFEDYDLCLRLAALGNIMYLAEMKLIHHGGYAARKGLWHRILFVRSGIRFFNQHGWRWA